MALNNFFGQKHI